METKQLIPYLNIKDANRAVEFYSKIFETSLWVLLKMPDGRVMHCRLLPIYNQLKLIYGEFKRVTIAGVEKLIGGDASGRVSR